ncbi:MAG: DUF2085 domain-containing protein [Candidatus Thermoplasmatota archaeon]|nr:DUF2085 domain-containing protein [Candidatus Thermoplasmatota archaeon]
MKRREKSSRVTIIISLLFLLFLIWILLQFLAPIALPYQSVSELDGTTIFIDNQEKINNMTTPWGSIYGCGDRLCHQKADRSFFINGNEMPFCTRCTAIWLGLAIGLGFMTFYKINLDEKFIILIFIGLFPIGIDGFGQLFGLWESNNIIRVITGVLTGFICGLAIGIIIDEVSDIFISRKKNY